MKILARKAWTTTAAKGAAFNWGRNRGAVVHYPAAGKDVGILSQAQEASRLRGWRNYHVNGRGWSDIGYNYAIGQSGRVWELRGNRAGAHATGHNSTTVGVLFIVGDNEALTEAAKQAFRDLRAHLRRQGMKASVWGHQQMAGASTRCPGPFIMRSLREGELTTGASAPAKPAKPAAPTPTAGTVPGPGHVFPWPSGHYIGPISGPDRSRSGFYPRKAKGKTDREWIREFVNQLVRRGWNAKKGGTYLTKHGNDGLYGTELRSLIRAFQASQGLTVDGLAGKRTWDEAFHRPVT